MIIQKARIMGSPFLGVFCAVSETTGLLPKIASQKDSRHIEEHMGIEAIHASVAESAVLGALAKISANRVIVPEIAEEREIEEMRQKGLKVTVIDGNLALGNLIAVCGSKAVISPVFSKKQAMQIEKGLGVEAKAMTIAGTDIVGGSVLANKNGFAINPNAAKKEFEQIAEYFGLNGKACTANFGDTFVANSCIANSRAIIVGENTSGVEIMRLQEALGE